MLEKSLKQVNYKDFCANGQYCQDFNCNYFHTSKRFQVCKSQQINMCPTYSNIQCRNDLNQNDEQLKFLFKNYKNADSNGIFRMLKQNELNPIKPSSQHKELWCSLNGFSDICLDIILIIYLDSNLEEWIGQFYNHLVDVIKDYQDIGLPLIRFGAVVHQKAYIKCIQLSSNVEDFVERLKKTKFGSRNDMEDDLTEVLRKAYQLNCSNHPDSILKLILIRQYFQLELLLNQDEKKQNLKKMFNCLKITKKNFYLSIFSIDQNTFMQNQNQEFDGLDCKYVNSEQDFQKYIKQEIKESFDSVKFNQNCQEQKLCIQAIFQDQREMPFNYIEGCYIKHINHQIEQTRIYGRTYLYIDQQQIGTEQNSKKCICYKAYDEYHKSYVIIKIPSFILKSKEKLNQKDIEQAYQFAQDLYQQQLIAIQIANSFNSELKNRQYLKQIVNNIPQIYFVKSFLFTLSRPFMGLIKIYGETFLQVPDQWRNYGKFSQHDHPIDALFHFSYIRTNKQLLIANIQGKENLLCKPQIHTKNKKCFQGLENRHSQEFQDFFQVQHLRCNYLCKTIFKFEIQNYLVFYFRFKTNYFLCQWCFQITLIDKEFICVKCNQKSIKQNQTIIQNQIITQNQTELDVLKNQNKKYSGEEQSFDLFKIQSEKEQSQDSCKQNCDQEQIQSSQDLY